MIILQNHQQHGRPSQPRRQGKTYRVDLEDLLCEGELDTSMVKWCEHRRDEGAALFLWSADGKCHAREEARRMGAESLFSW